MLTRGLSRRSLLSFALGPSTDVADGSVVVQLFLRGGADGLALVPPLGDPRLSELRPTLASDPEIALDAGFGLHPALAPLLPLYRAGSLGIVHAVGSDDATRSHFEAQDRMEHAGVSAGSMGSGWLARLARQIGASGALSTIAIASRAPEALRGATSVAVLERASEHRVADDAFVRALRKLHGGGGAIARAGADALASLDRLRALPPSSEVRYPEDDLGRRLAELARLIRGGAGVRVACVDQDGWDTHFVQARALDDRARVLAESLRAFWDDLGDARERTTVLVLTEFGRRAYENTALGTDHGRASVLFALGAGVRGGRVLADWPGLRERALEEPGDLRVTTDYRAILAELVEHRFPRARVDAVIEAPPRARPGLFG